MGVSLATCDARRMLLRRERADDVDVIHQIHLEAFGALGIYGDAPPVEAQLVRDLRADDGWVPALSIVAETAEGAVVGHVVATEGHLEGARVVGLGPLGVLPDQQKAGVGSALMHAVLGAADAVDDDLVALLGDPGYTAGSASSPPPPSASTRPTRPGATTSRSGPSRHTGAPAGASATPRRSSASEHPPDHSPAGRSGRHC